MQNAAFRALGIDAVYVALRCARGGRAGAHGVHSRGPAAAATSPSRTRRSRRTRSSRLSTWVRASTRATPSGAMAGRAASATTPTSTGSSAALDRLGGAGRSVAARRAPAARRARSRRPRRRSGASSGGDVAGRRRAARVLASGPSDAGRATRRSRRHAGVLINATPLGLAPADRCPIAADAAPDARVALDLVYAPGETRLGAAMRDAGASRRGRPRDAGGAGRRGVRALVPGEARAGRGDAGRGRCCAGVMSRRVVRGAGALAPAGGVPPLRRADAGARGRRAGLRALPRRWRPVPPPWCARCGQPAAGRRRVPALHRLARRRWAGCGAPCGWRGRRARRCITSSTAAGRRVAEAMATGDARTRAVDAGGGAGAGSARGARGSGSGATTRRRSGAALARASRARGPTSTCCSARATRRHRRRSRPRRAQANVAGAFMAPAPVAGVRLCWWMTSSPPAPRWPRPRRRCGRQERRGWTR